MNSLLDAAKLFVQEIENNCFEKAGKDFPELFTDL